MKKVEAGDVAKKFIALGAERGMLPASTFCAWVAGALVKVNESCALTPD